MKEKDVKGANKNCLLIEIRFLKWTPTVQMRTDLCKRDLISIIILYLLYSGAQSRLAFSPLGKIVHCLASSSVARCYINFDSM